MNGLSGQSSAAHTPSLLTGEGFDTPSLPFEITYQILEKLAESAQTKEELVRDVKAFLIVQTQIFKREQPEFFQQGETDGFRIINTTISKAVAYATLHACNEGAMTPQKLGIENYAHLLEFVGRAGSVLKVLKIDQFGIRLTDERAEVIGGLCPSLGRIDTWQTPLSDRGISGLVKGKRVTHLKIACGKLTSGAIKSLTELPLVDLSLILARGCTDEVLQEILKIKTLKRLHISYANQLTDQAFLGIQESKLESIELAGMDKVTDAGLLALLDAPRLTSISLRKMPAIKGSAFTEEGTWRNRLRALDLTGSQVTDEALAGLSSCTALSSLVLVDCKKITKAGIALLDKPGIGDISLAGVEKKKRLLPLTFTHHTLNSAEWRLSKNVD